jgi:hypothetical protein
MVWREYYTPYSLYWNFSVPIVKSGKMKPYLLPTEDPFAKERCDPLCISSKKHFLGD